MKKSLFCILLAMVLLVGSLPVALANTMLPEDTLMDNPRYANSFLLWVESETKRAYTPADFPNVERLYSVSTVKLTATETGYQCLLLMAIDNYNVAKAIQQASAYGMVLENCLASDYADAKSFIVLNHDTLELKVGEVAKVEVVCKSLVSNEYVASAVQFTIDPDLVDEVSLMESGYKDWGLSCIYSNQEPLTEPWFENVAVMGQPYGSPNEVSTVHCYYSRGNSNEKLFQIINTLSNQPGVIKAELVFSSRGHATVMPGAGFSASPKGIVDIQFNDEWGCTLTALQPGETIVMVRASGGGIASATATCKVTVVEDTPPAPETPTDTPTNVTPTDTPSDVTPTHIPYVDINGDEKVDAKDALMVLKYVVQKAELTQAQQKAAEVDGIDGINAKDALQILKYAVKKIDTFPAQKVDNLPAVLYQFEYGAEGAPQQEDTTVILRSAREVQEFLVTLDEAGLSNEQVTALLRSRANDKYFKNYTLLVKYNHGINGGDSGHQVIASIEKEGTTATIDAVPNFTSDGAPDARYSAWVKIGDLPNHLIEGCHNFVIS